VLLQVLFQLCLSSMSGAFFCGSRCVSVFMFLLWLDGLLSDCCCFFLSLVVGVGSWGARALFSFYDVVGMLLWVRMYTCAHA